MNHKTIATSIAAAVLTTCAAYSFAQSGPTGYGSTGPQVDQTQNPQAAQVFPGNPTQPLPAPAYRPAPSDPAAMDGRRYDRAEGGRMSSRSDYQNPRVMAANPQPNTTLQIAGAQVAAAMTGPAGAPVDRTGNHVGG